MVTTPSLYDLLARWRAVHTSLVSQNVRDMISGLRSRSHQSVEFERMAFDTYAELLAVAEAAEAYRAAHFWGRPVGLPMGWREDAKKAGEALDAAFAALAEKGRAK